MGTKHIPQRTCIACRAVRGKRELARIVRTPEQRVVADPTGKQAGRGAYLCRARECWETALSAPGRLASALNLEMSISQDDLARLREFAATLPPRERTNAVPSNEKV
jgi:predicted RNA-binding protein YlxR (DUF448 family)